MGGKLRAGQRDGVTEKGMLFHPEIKIPFGLGCCGPDFIFFSFYKNTLQCINRIADRKDEYNRVRAAVQFVKDGPVLYVA
jgi:hypothetical protein